MTWFLTSQIVTHYFMNITSLQELKIVSQTFILHILISHIVEYIYKFGGKLKFEIYSKKSESDVMKNLYDCWISFWYWKIQRTNKIY
jgi:hypothetical protein